MGNEEERDLQKMADEWREILSDAEWKARSALCEDPRNKELLDASYKLHQAKETEFQKELYALWNKNDIKIAFLRFGISFALLNWYGDCAWWGDLLGGVFVGFVPLCNGLVYEERSTLKSTVRDMSGAKFALSCVWDGIWSILIPLLFVYVMICAKPKPCHPHCKYCLERNNDVEIVDTHVRP